MTARSAIFALAWTALALGGCPQSECIRQSDCPYGMHCTGALVCEADPVDDGGGDLGSVDLTTPDLLTVDLATVDRPAGDASDVDLSEQIDLVGADLTGTNDDPFGDAWITPLDAGSDGPMDLAVNVDAAKDAAADAAKDAATDAAKDAATDAATDAALDAATDAGTDAGIDAAVVVPDGGVSDAQ